MKESLKNWWSTAEVQEKKTLTVLGAISAGTLLLASGIIVGRAIAVIV